MAFSKLQNVIVAAICVTLFTHCHKNSEPAATGPASIKEVEPNDTPANAQLITSSTSVEGTLASQQGKPDEDWYLLKPAKDQIADIVVAPTDDTDVILEVADDPQHVLLTVNEAGPGKSERLPNLSIKGSALIRLRSAKKEGGGAYSMSIAYSDASPEKEAEPNNRKVDATPLALGAKMIGFVSTAADEDWYRIELPDDVPAIVSVDAGLDSGVSDVATPSDAATIAYVEQPTALHLSLSKVDGVRLSVALLTEAEGELFKAQSAGESAPLDLRNIGSRPGDKVLYVVVKSAWIGPTKDGRRGSNASAPYTLQVTKEEAGSAAEIEPNDDPDHATPLEYNQERVAFLNPKGDVDFFKVHVDKPSLINVTVTGLDKVDIQLSAFVANKGIIDLKTPSLEANEGQFKEPEMLQRIACTDDCYFEVRSAATRSDAGWVREGFNATTPYEIRAEVFPDTGAWEREPNQSIGTATTVSVGQPIRGTIFPKRDVDYYRLDLSGKQVKTAIKASVTGLLKVDIALYLHRLGESDKLTLIQTADQAKKDATETIRATLEPGVYILEVRDSKSRESNFQDAYQLSIEESAE